MDIDDGEFLAKLYTRGRKRDANDDLLNEQRLAKRLNSLKISPKDAPPDPPPLRRKRSNAFSDSMNVEDSRDRVYISNLEDELRDIESEDEKLVFLPDIEKKLNNIPKWVLNGEAQPTTGHEIVLYKVPESLSVPKEQDTVHKVMEEARTRAREKSWEKMPKNLDSSGENASKPLQVEGDMDLG